MNYLETVKNFFREDFSDVVGIFYDGFKIYLARITDKIELDEVSWEIYLDTENSYEEQLAEKIAVILSQRGWKSAKVGLCLKDTDAIIFHANFDNIPQNEIESAVKVWATAQAGENSCYDFLESDGEIWAETVPKTLTEKYISAFEKNSVNLCVLTAMPNFSSESSALEKNSDKAIFIAEILKEKKVPNLLTKKITEWNLKKIFLTAAGIFLFLIAGLSTKIFYDYRTAENELATIQKILSEKSELLILKEESDENIAEMKKINSILAEQKEKFSKLNILIQLGKISDGKVKIQKIIVTENSVQIEGIAKNSETVEKYLRKLKNSVAENSKLENASTTNDGKINFTVKINKIS